jgi:hypothetical protein
VPTARLRRLAERVHVVCVVTAGVDAGRFDAHQLPAFVPYRHQQDLLDLLPRFRIAGRAVDFIVEQSPRFLPTPIRANGDRKPIVLRVDAGHRNQATTRTRHRQVSFRAISELLGFDFLPAGLAIRFAELVVGEVDQLL